MASFGSSRFSAGGGGLGPGTEWTILGVFEEVFQTHHYLTIKFDSGDKKTPIDGISLGLRRLFQAKTVRRIVNNAEQEEATVATPAGSLVDLVHEEVAKLGPSATNDQVREALNKVLPGKHVRIVEDFLYVDAFHKVKTWVRFELVD